MNPVLEVASTFNVSQQMLQFGIMITGGILVLGLYWRIIVPGIIIVLVGCVFLDGVKLPTPASAEQKQIIVNKKLEKEFMNDCMNVANYSEEHCTELWQERVQEEKSIKGGI